MDARTIETRLKEIAGGADMVRMKQITKYTGSGRDWVASLLREHSIDAVGKNKGALYHIHDVAKALAT